MPDAGGRLVAKSAVVTGSGRGIERAAALRLATDGASVAICGRTVADLERTAARIREQGGQALAAPVDVSDEAAMEAFLGRVAAELGGIDVLGNNASRTAMSRISAAPLADMPAAEWRREIEANLNSMFFATRFVGRLMRERGSGAVVNDSSVHAHRPHGLFPHYDVAKAGVEATTRNAALNLGAAGVRVNAVAPGPIGVREPGQADVMSAVEREALPCSGAMGDPRRWHRWSRSSRRTTRATSPGRRSWSTVAS